MGLRGLGFRGREAKLAGGVIHSDVCKAQFPDTVSDLCRRGSTNPRSSPYMGSPISPTLGPRDDLQRGRNPLNPKPSP